MKLYYKISALIVLLSIGACGDSFLERSPQRQFADEQAQNTKAVAWLLPGAYGLMNGNRNGTWGNYASPPSQWRFGNVGTDNAHKGSQMAYQAVLIDIEK